jgi:hypothetical protein
MDYELKHLLWAIAGGLIVRFLYDGARRRQPVTTTGMRYERLWSDNPNRAYTSIPLKGGNAGTFQTLRVMREMVRRDCQSQWLRRYATELVKGCKGHDFWCEIVRCFEFARDGITYRRDPSRSRECRTPEEQSKSDQAIVTTSVCYWLLYSAASVCGLGSWYLVITGAIILTCILSAFIEANGFRSTRLMNERIPDGKPAE